MKCPYLVVSHRYNNILTSKYSGLPPALQSALCSAGTETENICNLHNSGAVQDPEPLPSRFENVPPAFKSFAGKKKTKKTKKLPTYCVFCKVRQLIEYTFIESSITSNIPVCHLSRNAERLLWNIVKFEHYQNVLQHFNNVSEQQRVGGGVHVPRAEGHGRQGGLPRALRLRLPHLQQHWPQGELRLWSYLY